MQPHAKVKIKKIGANVARTLSFVAGFGIAGSARVGGSARGPDPRGGRPVVLGSNFFDFFYRKMAFWGDVCVEKIDFFGKLLQSKLTFLEVVVEKMDFVGKLL